MKPLWSTRPTPPLLLRRRTVLAWGGLGSLLPCTAPAHDYPEPYFTILHPWVPPAPKGTPELRVSMRIISITRDDRLLSAQTTIGELALRVPGHAAAAASGAASGAGQVPGIPLRSGRDLTVNLFGPHFVLKGVQTELLHGAEYPLTLHFERQGAVEAALIVGQD